MQCLCVHNCLTERQATQSGRMKESGKERGVQNKKDKYKENGTESERESKYKEYGTESERERAKEKVTSTSNFQLF